MAGAGGGAAGAGGAGNPIADQIKTALQAANKWVLPCGANQSYSDLVCINNPGNRACPLPPANPTLNQYVLANTLNRNDMIKLPGTAADGNFNVRAHFQGIVEPKAYQRCTRATPVAGTTATNNGFCVGGEPVYSGNYNVYMIWVSAPTPTPTLHNNAGAALAGQYYWLNNIGKTEAHFSYIIDYTVTFQVQAGAMMQFVADDSNCSAIRNCDITSLDQAGGRGRCDMLTVAGLPAAAGITQPYNGQFVYMNVLDVAPAP